MNNKVDIFLGYLFSIVTIAIFIFIAIFLNRGTSCDEGYYLMGYLPGSPSNGVSDFHTIVKTLFCWLGPDPSLGLRWVRYLLTIVLLGCFAHSSYNFLKERYRIIIPSIQYYSLVFLSGSLSFCLASPVLYYDSIQMLLYLAAFSILFRVCYVHGIVRYVLLVFLGCILVFACMNYLPSGILLIVALLFLGLVFSIMKCKDIVVVFVGLLLGSLIYHLCFGAIDSWLMRVLGSMNANEDSKIGHEKSNLLNILFEYLSHLGVVLLVSFLACGGIYYYFCKKRQNRSWVLLLTIIGLILLTLIIIKPARLGIFCLFVPIGMLFAEKVVERNMRGKESWMQFLFVVIMILLPSAAVFGTNQAIKMKEIMFVPFIVIAFVSLLKTESAIVRQGYTIMCFVLMCALCVMCGYFNHYHYYYSLAKNEYCENLEGCPRFNKILVSKSQKEFIERTQNELSSHGFCEGDKVLAFLDNLTVAYCVGAHVACDLSYGLDFLLAEKDFVMDSTVRYYLLNKMNIEPLTNVLKYSNIDFPDGFERIELGIYADGRLPRPDYESVLFVRKE